MKTTSFFRTLTFVAATTLLAAPAFAQDDLLDEDEDIEELDEDEPAATDESSDEDDSPSDDGGEAAAEPQPTGGDIQTIFVIQGKPRLTAGSFELTPQFMQSVNDRFTSHTGLMVSGIYHLKENVAFELNVGGFFWWDDPGAQGDPGPRLGGRDTDLTVEIRQKERLAPELVQLYRLTWLTTFDLQWSPIYGKVSLHDTYLGQFNVYLSVGAGLVGLQLENQQALGTFFDLKGKGFSPTTSFGGGLRFYFGDWFGVRVEVRDYVSPLAVIAGADTEAGEISSEPFSTFDVTNTLLLQLGASFIF
jgi:outer membrane beta-barrel protein